MLPTSTTKSNKDFSSDFPTAVQRGTRPHHNAKDCAGAGPGKSYDITINGRFLTQKLTGVQRYCREIIMAMDKLLQDEDEAKRLRAKIVVPRAGANSLRPQAIEMQPATSLRGGPLWTQCLLPFFAQGVLLSLGNIGPVLSPRQIVCIHDANIHLAPESYSRAFRFYYRIIQPLLAKTATQVVTVSNFSAQMLAEFKLCELEKITVIPNGHEHVRCWEPARSTFAQGLANSRPFVFALGSLAKHKNVRILFEIAKELDALGLDLLVAGAPGRFFSPVEFASAPNVRIIGFVSDDDLAALYRQAFCFAFPSLTEGFGLPALEAMALGCPVIASGCASLPEVCGQAALYADPKSPRAWIEQIQRLHTEQGLSERMRSDGFRQARKFSWTQSAQLYLDIISSHIRRSGS